MKRVEELVTRRLLLRPFRAADLQDLYDCLSDPEVVRFEPYPPATWAKAEAALCERMAGGDMLAVERREDGRVIGNVCLGGREFEALELGICFGGTAGGGAMPLKPVGRWLKRPFPGARIESMRSATRKTPRPGGCWSAWAFGGRRISGKTSISGRMRRAVPAGRIPMCMVCSGRTRPVCAWRRNSTSRLAARLLKRAL